MKFDDVIVKEGFASDLFAELSYVKMRRVLERGDSKLPARVLSKVDHKLINEFRFTARRDSRHDTELALCYCEQVINSGLYAERSLRLVPDQPYHYQWRE